MQFITDFPSRRKEIAAGRYSFPDHIRDLFARISAAEKLNIFIATYPEESIAAAKSIELKLREGTAGRLAGMVIAVKDVLSISGKTLTCASGMLKNFTAEYTATAVQRLIDEDALIIGKTNCDEFAMGSSNENSAFGPVRNPVSPEFVPGGSSGGSAAAVAAGLCDAALGTDTGGSIRQPAAFCGVFGLKPTYGRVSRFGLTAFASSFDSVGPFANDIETVALLLEIMAGKDPKDETSSAMPVERYSVPAASKKMRFGIPEEYIHESLQPAIRREIDRTADALRSMGHSVSRVSLPVSEYAIATYYILTTAEASSNLARYDGARYGYRASDAVNLKELYVRSRSEGFGKEVKRRIMLGTYVLSSGYYDAYYRKAQQVRRLIRNDFDRVFTECDVLLAPTAPTTAFRIGEKTADPLEMYLADIYTISANLAGIPGLVFPSGKDENGLPVGLQLMGNHFSEQLLFTASKEISRL